MRANGSSIASALAKGYTMADLREMDWEQFLEVTGSEPRTIKVTIRGMQYACLDVAYWDPEKKKPTHRRKTIGYYDDSGKIILTGSEDDIRKRTSPKPEVYAIIKEIGRDLLFDSIAERTGLTKIVKDVFNEDAEAILTCAYYLAGHSGALCHCEQWSKGSDTPIDRTLADQRISELLRRITFDLKSRFFKEWVGKLGDKDNYALDITSISSYSEMAAIIRSGYNRDKEDLEQINLALMIGSDSRLPAYYSIIPGNINDKTSLKRFLHTVKAFGFERFSVVMDKGFFTIENTDEMSRLRQRFLISVENRLSFAKEHIDAVRGEIQRFDNFYDDGASRIYCTTKTVSWASNDGSSHRCYVHVFFNPQKKEDDVRYFTDKLEIVRKGILEGDYAYSDSPMAKKYFTVSGSKGRVKVTADQEMIDKKTAYSGFIVMISNHIKDAKRALQIYRDKETAESAFDDMKNGSDFCWLRVHGEPAIEAKSFLVFLSLILRLEMSNVMLKDPVLRSKSREEILQEMAILRRSEIGNNIIYSERTKLQKQVIKAFGIDAPFKDVLE